MQYSGQPGLIGRMTDVQIVFPGSTKAMDHHKCKTFVRWHIQFAALIGTFGIGSAIINGCQWLAVKTDIQVGVTAIRPQATYLSQENRTGRHPERALMIFPVSWDLLVSYILC